MIQHSKCDMCNNPFPYGIKFRVTIQSRLPLYKQTDYVLCPHCADKIKNQIERKNKK